MKRILVLGSFGYCNNQLDGQTIKTRQVYRLLKERYEGKVDYFCTQPLRQKPYLLLVLLYKIFVCSTVVALYSSTGGFRKLVPKLYKLTHLLSKRLIYIAIGPAQVDCMEGRKGFLERRDDLIELYRHLDAFLPETQIVQQELIEKYAYTNVALFPNFRYFDESLPFSPASKGTLRLVYMGRIMLAKGYDVACEFFNHIKGMGLDITLDFYGQMDGECNEDFLALMKKYEAQGVSYKGALNPENISRVLTDYDVMLLPTRADGIPGTVIDGYIASLPVVATNWQYAHEVIEDGKNGFIVAYHNPRKQQEFNERILQLYADRELLNRMKRSAFETRKNYSPDAAWKTIEKYL